MSEINLNTDYNLTITSKEQLNEAAAADQGHDVAITFPVTDYLCPTLDCSQNALNVTVTSEGQLNEAAAADQGHDVTISVPMTNFCPTLSQCGT